MWAVQRQRDPSTPIYFPDATHYSQDMHAKLEQCHTQAQAYAKTSLILFDAMELSFIRERT